MSTYQAAADTSVYSGEVQHVDCPSVYAPAAARLFPQQTEDHDDADAQAAKGGSQEPEDGYSAVRSGRDGLEGEDVEGLARPEDADFRGEGVAEAAGELAGPVSAATNTRGEGGVGEAYPREI